MIIDDKLFHAEFLNTDPTYQKPVNFTYSAVFLDENNNNILIHNVLRISKVSDFENNATDYHYITVDMFKGEYFNLLKVNRKKLFLRLTKTPCSFTGATIKAATPTSKVYEAALTDNTSEAIETRSGKLTGKEWDNLGGFQEVTIQLIELGYSEFRNWDCPAGVYKNCDITKLIQSFMSIPLKTLDQNMQKGFDCTVFPVDNREKFFQRRIPQGIRVTKFPSYLQNERGVYGNGLGSYLSNSHWFIYPLHNVERYHNDSKKITIINVPPNEMVGVNNTYFIDSNGELYIYATGLTKHIDTSDRNLNRTGTGFLAVNSNNLLDTYAKNVDGVLTIPKGQNVMNVNFDSRETNSSNINTTKPVTGNRYKEASKIIAGMTNKIVLSWEYSNPDLLIPGGPVRYIFKNGDTPYTMYGVLSAVHSNAQTPTQSITDQRYKSTSELVLTVQRADR